jgi:serralysin
MAGTGSIGCTATNDTLNGGAGNDHMYGGTGNDTYHVDHASDVVTESGGQGFDQVFASLSFTLTAGADVEVLATSNDAYTIALDLTGNSSGNIVRGNNGNNVINGGDGDDELTGLAGQDSFLFNTALDAATNLDVITDFSVADDTILLDNAIFSAFANGPLAAERFVVGPAAQDASDCIIYDSSTGALLYDADGTGSTAAIQFAELNAGFALTNLDFCIV